MSLRATLWAYDEAPVEKPTELLVLIALADEANDAGRNAFPAVAKIASRARCKPRAAKYALRALEDAGVIRRGDQSIAARHIARADRRPVVYDLDLTVTWASVGKEDPLTALRGAADAPRDGVHDDAPGSEERGAPERTDGVHAEAPRGAPEGTDGVHGGAPDPTTNPTEDPTTDPTPAADAAASNGKPQEAVIAEAWWEHYQATFGPVMRAGRSSPFIALRDNLIKPALHAGWTENEIKRALLGDGGTPDPVPPKSIFQRRLAEARSGNPGRRSPSNVHHLPENSAAARQMIANFERTPPPTTGATG